MVRRTQAVYDDSAIPLAISEDQMPPREPTKVNLDALITRQDMAGATQRVSPQNLVLSILTSSKKAE
jgi:hypothetical protein